MRMWQATAVAAVAIFGGSCAGVSGSRQLKDLEVRVAELETSNAELRRQLEELNTRLQMLQARTSVTAPAVAATAPSPDAAPAPASPAAAPQLEVIKLRPKRPAGPKTFTSWPEQPVLRTADGRVLTIPQSDQAAAGEEKAEAPAPVKPGDQSYAKYQDALQLYGDKRYAEAIVKFQELTGDSLAASLHDNAYYWLGECYYDLGEYEKAVEEFSKLANDYPESDKAPDGLYKAGLSYQELGQAEKALATLREVVILYPFSDSARLAEAKIEEWTH